MDESDSGKSDSKEVLARTLFPYPSKRKLTNDWEGGRDILDLVEDVRSTLNQIPYQVSEGAHNEMLAVSIMCATLPLIGWLEAQALDNEGKTNEMAQGCLVSLAREVTDVLTVGYEQKWEKLVGLARRMGEMPGFVSWKKSHQELWAERMRGIGLGEDGIHRAGGPDYFENPGKRLGETGICANSTVVGLFEYMNGLRGHDDRASEGTSGLTEKCWEYLPVGVRVILELPIFEGKDAFKLWHPVGLQILRDREFVLEKGEPTKLWKAWERLHRANCK